MVPGAGIEPARLAAGDFESLPLVVIGRLYMLNQFDSRHCTSVNAYAVGRMLEAKTTVDSCVALTSLDVMVST